MIPKLLNANFTSGSPIMVKPTTWLDMESRVSDVSWAWELYLPNGFVTMVAGRSGSGKSSVVLRLCGCFTEGWDWPDGTPFTGEKGSVLWCEAEAAQAINLGRAKKYGLDLGKILTPFDDPLNDINLSNPIHKKRLREKAFLPQVKVIVIDSLKGANTSVENDSQIFEIVKFLAELSRDTGKVVILIHHLRKKGLGEDDNVTLDHIRGSSAITQTPRMVWAINSELDGSKENTFQVIKSNLGEFPPAIGFQITEDGVEFFEPTKSSGKHSQVREAEKILKDILHNGPYPARDIEILASKKGIAMRTFNEAKKNLGIQSKRIGGRNGFYVWILPPNQSEPDEEEYCD
jgi:putative DNA primase/helicase